ncbi:MAG: OmpA family protein [Saprospiraceae bacterium]|nr:OmpA family protein [Saprospiraceae bacterium]
MTRILFSLLFFTWLFANTGFAQIPFDSLRLLTYTDVYFDFGKFDIRDDANTVLQNIVQALPGNAMLKINITAHTDAIGEPERNLKLSEQRATSVRDALIARGLPDSIFQTQVFGENRPIATNDTDAGRQSNRRATIEVFRLERMIKINGKIVNPETGEGISGEVILHSPSFRDTMQTDTSGAFEATLPVGENFGVDVFAPGYFFETQILKAVVGEVPRLEIPLKPVKVGASIDLKNFYFVGGQAVLLKHSEPELPKLLKFMQLNPFISIEIAGHINLPNQAPVSEDSQNFMLSLRRAKLVHDFLIENSIEPLRVIYKGYGNWQMRYPNARDETQQALNRRVEIKVVAVRKN